MAWQPQPGEWLLRLFGTHSRLLHPNQDAITTRFAASPSANTAAPLTTDA